MTEKEFPIHSGQVFGDPCHRDSADFALFRTAITACFFSTAVPLTSFLQYLYLEGLNCFFLSVICERSQQNLFFVFIIFYPLELETRIPEISHKQCDKIQAGIASKALSKCRKQFSIQNTKVDIAESDLMAANGQNQGD